MSTVHLRLSIHIYAAVSPPALGAKVLHHEDVASEHDVGDRPTIDIRIRSNGIVQIYVDKEGEGEGEGKEGEDAVGRGATTEVPLVNLQDLRSEGSNASLACHVADNTSEDDENDVDNGRTNGQMLTHWPQHSTTTMTTMAIEVAGAGGWMTAGIMSIGEGPHPGQENSAVENNGGYVGEEYNTPTEEDPYVGKETQMDDDQEHDDSDEDMSL